MEASRPRRPNLLSGTDSGISGWISPAGVRPAFPARATVERKDSCGRRSLAGPGPDRSSNVGKAGHCYDPKARPGARVAGDQGLGAGSGRGAASGRGSRRLLRHSHTPRSAPTRLESQHRPSGCRPRWRVRHRCQALPGPSREAGLRRVAASRRATVRRGARPDLAHRGAKASGIGGAGCTRATR